MQLERQREQPAGRSGPAVWRRRAMAAVVGLAAATASAQGAPAATVDLGWREDETLQALIAEGLERHPDLRAALAERQVLGARPAQVGAWPDPAVQLGYANDGWGWSLGERDMTTLSLSISQSVPARGARALRRASALRDQARGEQNLVRARWNLAAGLARAYLAWLQAGEQLELTHEQAQLWRQAEGVARARYAVGQGAQQDVLRVQIELTRVEQRREQQQAQVELRRLELNEWLGRPADTAFEASGWPQPAPADSDPASAVERLSGWQPELLAARLDVERADLALRLAQSAAGPEWSFQAGYLHRGRLDPLWQAGIGLSLPRAGRRRAAVEEARAALAAAQARLAGLSRRLALRTRQRLVKLGALERSALLYAEGLVPQDRMSVQAALANYQAGQVPFLAVLETLGTLYSDRSAELALRAERLGVRLALEEASLADESTFGASVPASENSMSGGFAAGPRAAEASATAGPAAAVSGMGGMR